MYNRLGLAVYLSYFEDQKPMLEKMGGSGYLVFTSFHIQEEYEASSDYRESVLSMLDWLKGRGFQVVADISPRTVEYLKEDTLDSLLRTLDVPMVRPDYGFGFDDIMKMQKDYDIVVNASTLDADFIEKLGQYRMEVYAMHNFYPREETGLDTALYRRMNADMASAVKGIISFIPGDQDQRGPIHKGLPTLETHRYEPPYVAYLDFLVKYGNAFVFVGDLGLSDRQLSWIHAFNTDGIITLPVTFDPPYDYLYGKVFTIRPDSPTPLKRMQESREYAIQGDITEPYKTERRPKGTITMDNRRYKRYSGEIQITADDYPEDSRVNVIGCVHPDYMRLLDIIGNNTRIRLTKFKQ